VGWLLVLKMEKNECLIVIATLIKQASVLGSYFA
jgi:hypothetical protein